MLKVYDLDPYKERKFTSAKEIQAEAKRNLDQAVRLNQKVGGLWFNRKD